MRKLLLFAICLISNCLLLLNCSSNSSIVLEPTNPDLPAPIPTPEIDADSVVVSINSAIHIDTEPLSTRASNNDLYALQVIQKIPTTNEAGQSWTHCNSYASGYFDDIRKINIKLAKRYNYAFTLAYIPNGKNLMYKYPNGYYGVPCYNPWGKNGGINEVVYGDEFGLFGLDIGTTQAKNISEWKQQYNMWSPIERYQGVVIDFDPNTETTVNIKLYKMMIGFKLDISDFNSGVITIHGMDIVGHNYHIYPDGSGKGSIDFVVETELMPEASRIISYYEQKVYGEDYDLNYYVERAIDESTTQVHITYTNDKGEELKLYTNLYFQCNRNTKYKLSFSLDDAVRNGGITPEIVEDGEMIEENFPL